MEIAIQWKRRMMYRAGPYRCSSPKCCKSVYITATENITKTRIELGTCLTRKEKQQYTVYYNNNQSWQSLYEDRCCHGDIYVYYDYLTASPKTTAITIIRAASSTPSIDPPEVSIPSDPKNTSVLVTILLFSALLIILGIAALLYRRYRKSRSAPVENFTDHCDYLVIEECRITTHNYSVLEVTEESHPQQVHSPYTTNLSSTTTSIPCTSSEYETIQINTEPEILRSGVP